MSEWWSLNWLLHFPPQDSATLASPHIFVVYKNAQIDYSWSSIMISGWESEVNPISWYITMEVCLHHGGYHCFRNYWCILSHWFVTVILSRLTWFAVGLLLYWLHAAVSGIVTAIYAHTSPLMAVVVVDFHIIAPLSFGAIAGWMCVSCCEVCVWGNANHSTVQFLCALYFLVFFLLRNYGYIFVSGILTSFLLVILCVSVETCSSPVSPSLGWIDTLSV